MALKALRERAEEDRTGVEEERQKRQETEEIKRLGEVGESEGNPRVQGTTEKKVVENRIQAERELERLQLRRVQEAENKTTDSRRSERNEQGIAASVEGTAKKRT